MICDDCNQVLSSEEEPHFCAAQQRLHRAEYLVEVGEGIRKDRNDQAYYYRNRNNFDIQDNAASDPEQADREDN